MNRRLFVVLGLVGTVALGACSEVSTAPLDESAGAPAPGSDPIAAIAIDAGFSELVAALTYVDAELDTGLVDLFLEGREQYTVFAPTNAAFAGLYTLLSGVLGAPVSGVTDLPAAVVLDVLLYHVTPGRRGAVSVVPRVGERLIPTLQGERFGVRPNLTLRDGLSGIRPDAKIVTADISASNGVIHVIDQVIVPASVVAALTN
jgi:uncharacterized surface protein with fasciclin (FAS1) repeats